MTLLERFKEEHRTIATVLQVLDATTSRLARGETMPPALFADLTEFLATFVAQHDREEERQLFPLLVACGLERDTTSLAGQHDASRFYLRAMQEAVERYTKGDLEAIGSLVENAVAYANQERAHMRVEDEYLFPLADAILSTAGDLPTAPPHAVVAERAAVGSDTQQHYRHLITNYLALLEG